MLVLPIAIILGLVILPFLCIPQLGTRDPKFYGTVVLCLVTALYGISNGWVRQYKNKWIILFFAFLPINYFFSPKTGIEISGVPAPSWIWQSSFFLLIFFLAHLVISSVKFSQEQVIRLLRVMVWCGTISAIYGLLQWFGFDQFFPMTYHWSIAGMGNPGLLAAFLAMVLPLTVGLRMYRHTGICLLALVFLNSQVAFGAVFLSLAFIVAMRGAAWRHLMVGFIGILMIGLTIGYFTSPKIKSFIGDKGRFSVWGQIVKDVRGPLINAPTEPNTKRSLTGYGMGGFRYYFHATHPKMDAYGLFLEAHNDYMELFYNTGLIGLFLFLMGLWYFIRSCFPLEGIRIYMFASFIGVAVCAGGIFAWQNGAIIFYTLVLTGLLNQNALTDDSQRPHPHNPRG